MRHSTTALVRRYAHLSPSDLLAAVETVAAYGKPTVKSEPNSVGTVTETGYDLEDRQEMNWKWLKILERAMGFEPTTTSLGS